MIRNLCCIPLLLAASVWAQTPVSEPTGTLVGSIDGHAFDLPMICEESGAFFMIRTHDISFDMDKPSEVDAAVSISLFSGRMAVSAFVGGKKYQFGSTRAEAGRQFSYTGTIQGDAGPYDVVLEADCDG